MGYIEELSREIEQETVKMRKLKAELKEIEDNMDRKIQALKLLEGKNGIKRKVTKDRVPSGKVEAVQGKLKDSKAP